MSCTAGQKPPPSAASRNLFKSCPSPARWNGSPSRRERLNNQVVPFRSPADPPQCPECCANPRLLCRGTNGSNPSPSSGQSVSLRIWPLSQERRGFSAILAAVRGDNVGRDAQSPATSRRGGVVSLSDDIPVPQCCRTRFARLAAPAASEVGLAISVGLGLRIGSSKAEQAPLILPG